MRGVIIRKAKLISDDNRRRIISILNGELGVRDIHILEMKKESILGNHWHTYPEMMYILRGKGHWWLKHMITGEKEEIDLEAGDIMFKTGFIAHTAEVSEDAVILDGSCESWIEEDFNHVQEVLINTTKLEDTKMPEDETETPEVPEEPVEEPETEEEPKETPEE